MNADSRITKRKATCLLLSGLILIPVLFLLVAGCASLSLGGNGPAKSTMPAVKIGEIQNQPQHYNNTGVAITGTISLECASGCWFILGDDTGTIYVTLSQDNFAIPQLQGQTVTAEGTVRVTNGDITLLANRVITGSGTYP